MNIAAIHGSPKHKNSMSERLIGYMGQLAGAPVETHQAIKLLSDADLPQKLAGILKADVLLIVFPLYVDSLPAPLIALLTRLDHAAQTAAHKPVVYALCNCGFHEAKHNGLALSMVRAFARSAGMPYGYGLSLGAGPMLQGFKNLANGPTAPVHASLSEMVASMGLGLGREDVFVTVKFPRRLYILMAHLGWNQGARRNGVRRRMHARPHLIS